MKYLFPCLAAIVLLFTVGCSKAATEVNSQDDREDETPESPYAVSVNPASKTIPAEGDTFSAIVSSSADWTMSGEASWCEPSKTSGSNEDAVTFTVHQNTTESERTVTYTFQCGDESAKLTITQSQPSPGETDDPLCTVYYTTYHYQPVRFNSTAVFGANLISNTYQDGVGKMTFDAPVTMINGNAFQNCSDLTSISLPGSVTEIGSNAFYDCSSLTSVTFGDPNGWWRSTSGTATSGTSISSSDLSDPSTAAEYLTSTYYGYYWKKG